MEVLNNEIDKEKEYRSNELSKLDDEINKLKEDIDNLTLEV